jgi:hypothetical protein
MHHVSRAREEDGIERAAVRWVSKMITRREVRGEVRREKAREALGREEGRDGKLGKNKKREREGINP